MPVDTKTVPAEIAVVHTLSTHDRRAKTAFLGMLWSHGVPLQDCSKVEDAIDKATAAGIPWLQIMLALLPFIIQVFQGKPLDIQALIAAILALFTPKP